MSAFRRAFSPAFRPPFGASGDTPAPDLRAQVIAALYSGGRRGFLLDFSDKSTLFQDDAESSPVTAVSQQIAVARDISGNGLHFRQTTAGARALYQEDSAIGYARGDGTDDFMETVATNSLLTNADGMMFFAVGRTYDPESRRNFGGQLDSGANRRVWSDNLISSVLGDYGFGAQTPNAFILDRMARIADDSNAGWYTTIGAWAGSDARSRLKINGGTFVESVSTTPAVGIVSTPAHIFATPASDIFNNVDISLIGCVDRDQSTDAEILALVQQLLDARTPA